MATHANPPERSNAGWWVLTFLVVVGLVVGVVFAVQASSHPSPTQQWINHSQQQINNAPAG